MRGQNVNLQFLEKNDIFVYLMTVTKKPPIIDWMRLIRPQIMKTGILKGSDDAIAFHYIGKEMLVITNLSATGSLMSFTRIPKYQTPMKPIWSNRSVYCIRNLGIEVRSSHALTKRITGQLNYCTPDSDVVTSSDIKVGIIRMCAININKTSTVSFTRLLTTSCYRDWNVLTEILTKLRTDVNKEFPLN